MVLRYKVAVGIAEAIAYLHNGSERCIVHRDIKPSNILLSSKRRPRLCDFGLATWTPAPSVPFLCKTVKGTFGSYWRKEKQLVQPRYILTPLAQRVTRERNKNLRCITKGIHMKLYSLTLHIPQRMDHMYKKIPRNSWL